ncbi:MAG: hypothetical protein ACHQFX_11395 [Chitinophagales bacterium]
MLKRRKILALLFIFLLFFSCSRNPDIQNQKSQPNKPEGFGSITTGGTGKAIVHVTNLDPAGPGSLYNAMGSDRIIVFDVAGTINDFEWDSSNEFAISNLTIDGSSAPSPGITLDNTNGSNCLSFQDGCHDIIVKSIRVRNAGNDCINVVNGYNMIFDHISVSGGSDGNFDITAGAHDITVQYSIIGSGKLTWAGAMLIAYNGTRNISIHHNLFNSRSPAGVGERNPLIHCVDNINTTDMMVDFRCNIVWNWGANDGTGYGYGSAVDYGGTANFINNFYQTTGVMSDNPIEFDHDSTNARGYLSGNVSGNAGINPNSPSNHPLWTIPSWAEVTTEDACVAAALVLKGAGCQPLDGVDKIFASKVSLTNCH